MGSFDELNERYGSSSIGASADIGVDSTPAPSGFEPFEQETPEQQLEGQLKISTDLLSEKRQKTVVDRANDISDTLAYEDSFGSRIKTSFQSGFLSDGINRDIAELSTEGDRDGANALVEWNNNWEKEKASLKAGDDPNVVEKALYQAAESSPYMIKNALVTGASTMAYSQATKRIIAPALTKKAQGAIAQQSLNLIGKKGARTFAQKFLARALPKAALRMAASDALLTPAQLAAAPTGGGAVLAVAAEALQWIIIGGALAYDAIKIASSMQKNEESDLWEMKDSPVLFSPQGISAKFNAKSFAGQGYSEMVNAGIDPQYISTEATQAMGLLQAGVEALDNPLSVAGPLTGMGNKLIGKFATRAAVQQGTHALRKLKIPAKIGMFAVSRVLPEMVEEGTQGAIGNYYLSKSAKAYITEHPEVATNSALYSNLTALADTDAKQYLTMFVEETRDAGAVSLVFALAGIGGYSVGLYKNTETPDTIVAVEEKVEKEIATLSFDELNAVKLEVHEKYNNKGIEAWSYEDVVRVEASAEKLLAEAYATNNKELEQQANDTIVELHRAELRGDILAYAEENYMHPSEAQDWLIPGKHTKEEVRGFMAQIAKRRKSSKRAHRTAEAYLELVYGEDFEYKESSQSEAQVAEQSKVDDKAVKELQKALEDGTLSVVKAKELKDLFADRIPNIKTMTTQEALASVLEYQKKPVVDAEGKPITEKPVVEEEGKPVYTSAIGAKPKLDKAGKPVLDAEGKPVYTSALPTKPKAETEQETTIPVELSEEQIADISQTEEGEKLVEETLIGDLAKVELSDDQVVELEKTEGGKKLLEDREIERAKEQPTAEEQPAEQPTVEEQPVEQPTAEEQPVEASIGSQITENLFEPKEGESRSEALKRGKVELESLGVDFEALVDKARELTEQDKTTPIDFAGGMGKGEVEGIFSSDSIDRATVTSIPDRFLDENGNLKEGVKVRAVYVNGNRRVYEDARDEKVYKKASGLLALQVYTKGEAYNFALVAPKDLGDFKSPAKWDNKGRINSPSIGTQNKKDYTPLDMNTMNARINEILVKAGIVETTAQKKVVSPELPKPRTDIGVDGSRTPFATRKEALAVLNKKGKAVSGKLHDVRAKLASAKKVLAKAESNVAGVDSYSAGALSAEYEKKKALVEKATEDIAKKQATIDKNSPKTAKQKSMQDRRVATLATLTKRLESRQALLDKAKAKLDDARGVEADTDAKAISDAQATVDSLTKQVGELSTKAETARSKKKDQINPTSFYVQKVVNKKGVEGFVIRKHETTVAPSTTSEAKGITVGTGDSKRKISANEFVSSVWNSGRNKWLKELYGKEIGEDLREGSKIDGNAESILSQLIRNEVLQETLTGRKGQITTALEASVGVKAKDIRKLLSTSVKKYAGSVIGEMHGEAGVKRGMDLLRSMDTDNREVIASKMRALIRNPNAFVFNESEIKKLPKKEQQELAKYNHGEREVLVDMLLTMFSGYGIAKQESAAFFGKDIYARADTNIAHALENVLDTLEAPVHDGRLDGRSVASRAMRSLDALYKRLPKGEVAKTTGLRGLIELIKSNPNYEEGSNFRPSKVLYGSGEKRFGIDGPSLKVLYDRFGKSENALGMTEVEIQQATEVFALNEARARVQSDLDYQKGRDVKTLSAEKKEARTKKIAMLERRLGIIKEITAEQKKGMDDGTFYNNETGQDMINYAIADYKDGARIYAIERRLTPAVLSVALAGDSPFRKTGSTSFRADLDRTNIDDSDAIGQSDDFAEDEDYVDRDGSQVAERSAQGDEQALRQVEATAILTDFIGSTSDSSRGVKRSLAILKAEKPMEISREDHKLLTPATLEAELKDIENATNERKALIEKTEARLAVIKKHNMEEFPVVKDKATSYDSEEQANDSGALIRKNYARQQGAISAIWSKIDTALKGDYSTTNINEKIGELMQEFRKTNQQGKLRLTGEINSYKRLLSIARTQKKETADSLHKYVVGNENTNEVYQELQDANLSEAEFNHTVTTEANHFGMTVSIDKNGFSLTSPVSGLRLQISYHEEGLIGKDNQRKAGITRGDIIEIAGLGANSGTIKHELAEWAYQSLMTPTDQASIVEEFGSAHKWANAMQDYNPKMVSSKANGAINKVRNFFRRILGLSNKTTEELTIEGTYADTLSKAYLNGDLHKRDITSTDTTKSSIIPTAESYAGKSRLEIEQAFRRHKVMMAEAGIALDVDVTRKSSTLIYHMTRSDHHFSIALNKMGATDKGRKLIAWITSPRVAEQMSMESRLSMIAEFDGSKGVITEVIDNLKTAQTDKVAPIEKRLTSYMKEVFPAEEADKIYEVSIGGKKERVSGHTVASLLLASQDPVVLESMLTNKIQLSTELSSKLPKSLRKKTYTSKPMTKAEIASLSGVLASENRILDGWKEYTTDAGSSAKKAVEALATKGNYLSLKEGHVFNESPMWYPRVWASQITPTISYGEVISGKESWMMDRKGGKKNETLVIPDINEVLSSHARSIATVVGSGAEIQALNNLIKGPHGTSRFINREGMSNWNGKQKARMSTQLETGMSQTIKAGQDAGKFTRSAVFKYLKSGQDLYRLSNPVTMMKMASSAHLISSFLNDPRNVVRALAAGRHSKVMEKNFKANTFQYGRGDQEVVAITGDTNSRTKGRSTLQGTGGFMSGIRHLPAMADRLAMRTIYVATAYDELPASMARTQASLNAMDGDVAFWDRVSKKANRLTMETQPTYESFMRSDLLNRGSFVPLMVTRYGTQRNRMLNMMAKSYAKMSFTDSPAGRKSFEKTMTSVLVTNTLLLSSITAGSFAFQETIKSLIRDEGEEDDESLYAYEKKEKSLGRRTLEKFGGTASLQGVTMIEGGDELVKILGGLYGATTGKDYLSDRALQGNFISGELNSAFKVVRNAGNMGRQKIKMDEATTYNSYLTAKRSYSASAGKLYASMSNLIGVGLHIPTRAIDTVINPQELIRQSTFDRL